MSEGSDEARIRERRRNYVRWYVAVGAEAMALALLIVIVGRQLMPALGAAAADVGEAAWAHDLLVESRQLISRMSGAEAWTWLSSVLATLLTITGPWLRRPAARWGLAAVVGSRSVSIIAWFTVAVLAGFQGLS